MLDKCKLTSQFQHDFVETKPTLFLNYVNHANIYYYYGEKECANNLHRFVLINVILSIILITCGIIDFALQENKISAKILR